MGLQDVGVHHALPWLGVPELMRLTAEAVTCSHSNMLGMLPQLGLTAKRPYYLLVQGGVQDSMAGGMIVWIGHHIL